VNLGGEPDRDDFGLPPVDVEIPDDARELDRDVQAYHRELRAQRRRLRVRRLHGPLTRDGMVLPLLAGCLVLALISGTLLTLFSAGQADVPNLPGRVAARPAATGNASAGAAHSGASAVGHVPAGRTQAGQLQAGASAGTGPTAGPATATGPPAGVGKIHGQLPDKTLVIGGKPTRLRSLQPAVLALVPAGCQCTAAVEDLAAEAATAHVTLYLVGTGGGIGQLGQLAPRAARHAALLADDVDNVLGTTYPHSGLTAILVRADGSVDRVVRGLRPGLWLTPYFSRLSSGKAAGS